MGSTPQPVGEFLSRWLRLLWNVAPPLSLDSDFPYIAKGAIHLPPLADRRQHEAAAAHAAAHLVYSPPMFASDGLGPIARALVALLEDARVEALAIRELPGLARLWRPLHAATPASGSTFEALMARLARALADPRYDDPDEWVRKGRTLFYLDAPLGLLALRTPAEVVRAASLLGHDIGQMRLRHNAPTYRPEPAYRDDNRWMWPADAVEDVIPPVAPSHGMRAGEREVTHDEQEVHVYPEWDRLISRMRPQWCRVVEEKAPPLASLAAAETLALADDVRTLSRGLAGRLRRFLRPLRVQSRAAEGECIDLAASIDWRIARRMSLVGDDRFYIASHRGPIGGSMLLLIDRSASTRGVMKPGGRSVLQVAARAAGALAVALHALGTKSSIVAFDSNGRHEVRVCTLKTFDAAIDSSVLSRLGELQSGGSTRVGAAVRHAVERLVRRPGRRWMLVISDGEANDVDVHDPRYLHEDSLRATQEARRRSVEVESFLISAESTTSKRTAFARRLFPSLVNRAA